MRNEIIIAVCFIFSFSLNAQSFKQSETSNEPQHDITVVGTEAWAITYGTGRLHHYLNSSWEMVLQLDSGYYEQIDFVNERVGFIVGEKSNILMTTDRGVHWNRVGSFPYDDIFFYAVKMLDANAGIASGMRIQKIDGKNNFTPYHYITRDKGSSWSTFQQNINQIILRYFSSTNAGLIGAGRNAIIKIKKDLSGYDLLFSDSLKLTGDIRGVHFIDSLHGAGVSYNGYVLLTKDRGKSWRKIQHEGNHFRDVIMFNSQALLVVGNQVNDNNAILSLDGGTTWKVLRLFENDIHRIALYTKNKSLWVAGKAGLFTLKVSDLLKVN